MTKITILGASGQIAKLAEPLLLKDPDNELILFLRHPDKLDKSKLDTKRERLVQGDASKLAELLPAIAGSDIVYANLAGDNIEDQARTVVQAMDQTGVKRLIWISSLGVYDEVPGAFGKWNKNILGSYLTTYRGAADQITKSDLNYTVIRPAWLTNKNEIDYELTKGATTPFKGTEVSRLSVASYIASLVADPSRDIKGNVGLNKPNTDGDKPSWY